MELKAGVIRTPHNEGISFDRDSSHIAVTEDETEFYIKSEADKLIAELNIRICEGDEDFEIANNQIKRLLEIVRHQKYKRCLNNAWWCLREEFSAEDCRCERWVNWSIKWYERWLKIAKNFNPNKSTAQQGKGK